MMWWVMAYLTGQICMGLYIETHPQYNWKLEAGEKVFLLIIWPVVIVSAIMILVGDLFSRK